MTHRRQVEAILAGARAERAALLDQLSPELRAAYTAQEDAALRIAVHLDEQSR